MKSVGKQLQEARLAKNWTPELAARETKIKIDRLRDLEADDYSHFTSPTYARGFVRTYARSLGLDEYRILRQLDNKLPDDDSANIVTDSGVAYLPETAMPPRVAHRDFTGLYIVMGLGAVVTLAIVFVLFEAYRVGELSRWFASNPEPTATNSTNAAPSISTTNEVARALPVDSNTPPPIVEAATNAPSATNAAVATASSSPTPADATTNTVAITPPRALPVNPSDLAASTTAATTNAASTNAAPSADAPMQAVKALPVNPSDLTNTASTTPPRALPVNPSDLTNAAPLVALNTPAPVPHPSSTARQSNTTPVKTSSPPPVAAATNAVPAAPLVPTASEATTNTDAAPQTVADSASNADKRLVLTASQDSFVRVTDLDAPAADKPLYAAVLHSGQSVGFNGHKFSINVGIPSAVDIKLDGVNYGPHSDQAAPETFTVQSHLP